MGTKQQKKKIESGINKTDMARLYNVSLKTFSKWIEPFEDEIGPIIARALNPGQIKIILEKLHEPPYENH